MIFWHISVAEYNENKSSFHCFGVITYFVTFLFDYVNMNIAIVHNSKIPVTEYGGIERVIWYLGAELVKMGHHITYLVKSGSECPFAKIQIINSSISLNKQIPENTEFVHLHFVPKEMIYFPHLVTIHGNLPQETIFSSNTNFVSKNHALRYGADAFVYNGLDWDDYGKPDFD